MLWRLARLHACRGSWGHALLPNGVVSRSQAVGRSRPPRRTVVMLPGTIQVDRIARGPSSRVCGGPSAARGQMPSRSGVHWYAACEHGLPHIYATELANSNVSVYTLMKLVGHESMATSQRYVAGAASETRTAAAKKPYAIVRDRLQLGGHDIMNLSAACWRARLAWRRSRHSHQSPVVVEQASASRHGSVCRRAHLYRRHRDMRSRPVAPRHRSPGSTISGRPSPQPGEIA